MQRKITITSLTFNGDVALKKHMEEFNKIGFKNRLIFKTAGYRQEVVQEEPFILVLHANNRHCANPIFLDLIRMFCGP